MGGEFHRYDDLWRETCDRHGWDRGDCHGDHYDELTREESYALMEAWVEDLKHGATEYIDWDC
jgi:hypothetical protein